MAEEDLGEFDALGEVEVGLLSLTEHAAHHIDALRHSCRALFFCLVLVSTILCGEQYQRFLPNS